METRELTDPKGPAKTRNMQGSRGRGGLKSLAVMSLASFALVGCVTVEAPDEPIVIELNVNIRQEVIYRLAEDAGNTIEENADIF